MSDLILYKDWYNRYPFIQIKNGHRTRQEWMGWIPKYWTHNPRRMVLGIQWWTSKIDGRISKMVMGVVVLDVVCVRQRQTEHHQKNFCTKGPIFTIVYNCEQLSTWLNWLNKHKKTWLNNKKVSILWPWVLHYNYFINGVSLLPSTATDFILVFLFISLNRRHGPTYHNGILYTDWSWSLTLE